MNPRTAGGWVAAAAVVLGVVAAMGAAPAPPAGSSAPDAAAMRQVAVQDAGRSLYLQNCASCHGQQGEGASAGPSLTNVGRASTDFYLRTGRMPLGAPGQQPVRQKPLFSEEQIDAIVEYVATFGEGPEIPQVQAGGDIRRGWELYTANCAACHAATGAGNAVGGGFAAVGLGEATPVEIAEAMLIGPGVMPRFELAPEDRDAVVAYIEYLRGLDTPGGLPIGGVGPVAEGFVAIVVGLTLLLLVARFVGRRSHQGEPELPIPVPDIPDRIGHAGSDERGLRPEGER